ncbi:unnamed protein product, partial [Owenia fusiformis]
MSNGDKKVLYYITGYLLRTIKTMKIKDYDRDNILALAKTATMTTGTASSWTTALHRGGHMYPSDTFYGIIVMCENVVRGRIDNTNITATSLQIAPFKEAILEDPTILLQWETMTKQSSSSASKI